MAEDGACLFRSVAYHVYSDPEMHNIVRQQCMDYMVCFFAFHCLCPCLGLSVFSPLAVAFLSCFALLTCLLSFLVSLSLSLFWLTLFLALRSLFRTNRTHLLSNRFCDAHRKKTATISRRLSQRISTRTSEGNDSRASMETTWKSRPCPISTTAPWRSIRTAMVRSFFSALFSSLFPLFVVSFLSSPLFFSLLFHLFAKQRCQRLTAIFAFFLSHNLSAHQHLPRRVH